MASTTGGTNGSSVGKKRCTEDDIKDDMYEATLKSSELDHSFVGNKSRAPARIPNERGNTSAPERKHQRPDAGNPTKILPPSDELEPTKSTVINEDSPA
uniref:Uncharacterized protein n=1 Tax=Ditylenchus dipsaci TaxID=166011 RepID=A0A915EIH1_9BILA